MFQANRTPAPPTALSFAVESWLVPYGMLPSKTALSAVLETTADLLDRQQEIHGSQAVPSLIGKKPGVKRNCFQKDFENFLRRPGLFAYLYYTVKIGHTEKIWQ